MDLSNRVVWQQACGAPPRNYSDVCLRHGVILNGHDEAWTNTDSTDAAIFFGDSPPVLAEGCAQWIGMQSCSQKKKDDLTRFFHTMNEGDLVVLRWGKFVVFGVGVVGPAKLSTPQFGDVDGWNIALVRRVQWFWKGGPKRFAEEIGWGDTTQPLKRSSSVWNWLKTLPEPTGAFEALPELGDLYGQKNISIEEISEYLFDRGVASASIRHLVEEIGELVRIAKWYMRIKAPPSEHETVAYLVVPLLKALGWTPQKMAVEWKKMDVALFDKLPRSKESLRVVVEVKKLNDACLVAEEQAKAYAGETCDRIILTDGLRYGVHVRQSNGQFKLEAYLNLTRMRDDYPLLGYKGAQEALRLMTP